jgi:8-oxo-dGTP pyrophosphatase MutT (NUDIX family)
MVAGSILPVCIHNNKLYFLFGKENELEPVESRGWSDFGGGCDSGESPYKTALREGKEESTGCLDPKELVKKGTYKLSLNTYHIFIVKMDYDPMLPLYYNRMHKFIIDKLPKLNNTVIFEKAEMEWFSVDDMVARRFEFRKFYREIVDLLHEHKPHILKFIRSTKTKKNT